MRPCGVEVSTRCAEKHRFLAGSVAGWVLLSQMFSPGRAATPASTEPLRLPLQIIRSDLVTEIVVGDQKIQAGLDTGGGGITLSEDIIRNAGGSKLSEELAWTDAFGQEYRVPQFRIPVMSIGGRTFRDVVVSQSTTWPEGQGPAVSNAIGGQFMSQYLTVIDVPGLYISLWPAGLEPVSTAACGPARIPMDDTEQPGLVVSTFNTASGTIRMLWDTGASYSALSKSHMDRADVGTIVRGQTSFYRPARLTAAGHELGPLEFVILPLQLPEGIQGMLGANFFSTHVVCLDYKNREVMVR
jgi:hypothetical protein